MRYRKQSDAEPLLLGCNDGEVAFIVAARTFAGTLRRAARETRVRWWRLRLHETVWMREDRIGPRCEHCSNLAIGYKKELPANAESFEDLDLLPRCLFHSKGRRLWPLEDDPEDFGFLTCSAAQEYARLYVRIEIRESLLTRYRAWLWGRRSKRHRHVLWGFRWGNNRPYEGDEGFFLHPQAAWEVLGRRGPQSLVDGRIAPSVHPQIRVRRNSSGEKAQLQVVGSASSKSDDIPF
jgi:hypothetical protein